MYQAIRSLLFLLPAETAHYFSMNCLKAICTIDPIRKILSAFFRPSASVQSKNVFGLNFKNPVGLGAGFDKNAKYLRELEVLGFGFVEVGTVTPKAQKGNEQPRLFRLNKDKALVNRMGFNNEGVELIAQRLRIWKERKVDSWQMTVEGNKTDRGKLLIGGNIGKNKATPNEEAWKDYEACFEGLHDYVDFFVVNVSSPNTPGLRELQEKEALKKILTHLQMLNKGHAEQKPILLKIAPDLTTSQIDDVIDLAREISLNGLVATNTTISREKLVTTNEQIESIGAGGLSGLPVKKRSTEVVQYIRDQTNGGISTIGSGGIFTSNDAKEKFAAGASLIEVWTGFIYEGPLIVKKICSSLS